MDNKKRCSFSDLKADGVKFLSLRDPATRDLGEAVVHDSLGLTLCTIPAPTNKSRAEILSEPSPLNRETARR